jgi:cytochrome P450
VDVRQPWGPYGALFDEIFERNMARVRQSSAAQPIRFDLVEFARQTMWQTVAAMLGIDGIDGPEQVEVLQRLAVAFVNAATVEFGHNDPAVTVEAGRHALQHVREHFFRKSYERRLQQVALGANDPSIRLPGDLITTMILAANGAPDSELILRETMVFFTASVNNPVNQTSFALEDLESWLQFHPDDLSRLNDDLFFSRCVQETIRLHRTGNPYLLRRAVKDCELASGVAFKAGNRAALYIGVANLEEDVFGPDAKSFNPHRKLPEGIKPFGLGFGGGPHMCIGRPLLVFDQGSPLTLGFQGRFLKALVRAGVRPDPEGAREKPAHAADKYAHFGVMLTAPLVSGGHNITG